MQTDTRWCSVEKVWRKKTCEGEEFFIPAMKFYIKVYSEKGIQSIPEYLEAGIKEAIFEPVYELMECQGKVEMSGSEQSRNVLN